MTDLTDRLKALGVQLTFTVEPFEDRAIICGKPQGRGVMSYYEWEMWQVIIRLVKMVEGAGENAELRKRVKYSKHVVEQLGGHVGLPPNMVACETCSEMAVAYLKGEMPEIPDLCIFTFEAEDKLKALQQAAMQMWSVVNELKGYAFEGHIIQQIYACADTLKTIVEGEDDGHGPDGN